MFTKLFYYYFMMLVKRILNLFFLIVTTFFYTILAADSPIPKACVRVFDDWVSSPSIPNLCHGFYREEPLPVTEPSKNLVNQPITITADQGKFVPEGNSSFKGRVHLIERNRQIFSDIAIIHRNSNKRIDFVETHGNLKITEPGLRVEGTRGTFNIGSDLLTIQDASFRLYKRNARGTATCMSVCERTELTLKEATFTTCAPGQDTWILKAETVVLNKKTGRGRARHARLYLHNIPVFYSPYVDFPIDDRRQTGFLYPTVGHTSHSGFELSTPYYWNLAPNYDATLTPRYLSKRGLEVQGHFQYLTPNAHGELEGAVLPNDRAYAKFLNAKKTNPAGFNQNDPRVTGLNTSTTRSAIHVRHTATFNDNWGANVHYGQVSDNNYFVDFGKTLGMASTTQVLQQGEVLFQDRHWDLQARLQQYQTLHPYEGPATLNVYRRLPQVAIQNRYLDLPCGFAWIMTGEVAYFSHQNNPFTGNVLTTGGRFQLRPQLSLPLGTPGWFLKPRVQWNTLAYSLRVGPQSSFPSNHPTLNLPMLDVDSGLIFERPICLANRSFIQTLEPRAYYLYVPFQNQNSLPNFDTINPGFDANQLYRDNRFCGLDRVGDANQLTLGITTRVLNETLGRELLAVSLGQIFYFAPPKVRVINATTPPCIFGPNFGPDFANRQHRSALVLLANMQFCDELRVLADLEWDPTLKSRDKQAISMYYSPIETVIVNLGYQFLRRDPSKIDPKTHLFERLEQTDVGLIFYLNEHYKIFGRWHYDIQNRYSNNIEAGLEHEGCCTALRLSLSSFVRPFDDTRSSLKRRHNTAIYFQFIFKGFTGVSHKVKY